jgi:hypothetical protein
MKLHIFLGDFLDNQIIQIERPLAIEAMPLFHFVTIHRQTVNAQKVSLNMLHLKHIPKIGTVIMARPTFNRNEHTLFNIGVNVDTLSFLVAILTHGFLLVEVVFLFTLNTIHYLLAFANGIEEII